MGKWAEDKLLLGSLVRQFAFPLAAEVPMTPMPSGPSPHEADKNGLRSVADELKRESERLRQLAEELKVREAEMAEMVTNYPHLKQAVYALLREQFERELPPLPDKDLEVIAAEEGALPLEAFIGELETPAEGG